MSMENKNKPKIMALRCNFCGTFHNECKTMIAGPNVFICNECVLLCIDIIREKEPNFGALKNE